MAKTKARRRTTSNAAPAAGSPPRTVPETGRRVLPEWNWRSFPVFCAFVSGMLLAFLSNGATSNPVAFVLLIAALLGFGYCLAHLLVTNFLVAGRVRRRRAAIARGEEQPGDYEEDLVYPDSRT